jgi:hypothetical protein
LMKKSGTFLPPWDEELPFFTLSGDEG